MKIRYILLLLTVASLLGSCAAPKVAYFTDLKPGMAEQVLNPLEIRVRPEDKISILVNSKDPLLMDLFNLPIISRQIGIRSEASNNQGMSGYTINKDGNIDFPFHQGISIHCFFVIRWRSKIPFNICKRCTHPVDRRNWWCIQKP